MLSPLNLLLLLGIALALGLILLPVSIRLGHRFRLLDHPGRHKRHRRPVPLLGGTVVLIVVWLTILSAVLIYPEATQEIALLLPYIFLGALIVYGIGLLDDFRPQTAWVKLTAEIVAALILFLGGLRIDPVSIPFFGLHSLGPWSIVIAVLWVVLLTNSINLIDGLDGLAGGVSLIAGITMVAVGHLHHLGAVLIFAYALIGFLPAFLVYNWHPARIFLGDSGSLQIGYYFAVLSLVVPLKSFTAAALYIPLLALGVPILETATSFVRRLAAGKSVMRADRRHLFHYLALAGLSPRRIVWIFYGLSAVFGLFAVAMFFWDRVLVFTALVLFMVVIFGAFLIFMASQTRGKRKSSGGNDLR